MVPEGTALESVFTLLVAVDQHRLSPMEDAGPLSAGNPYVKYRVIWAPCAQLYSLAETAHLG
jgi:hypothetical protein